MQHNKSKPADLFPVCKDLARSCKILLHPATSFIRIANFLEDIKAKGILIPYLIINKYQKVSEVTFALSTKRSF
jgi:hypothetical protein